MSPGKLVIGLHFVIVKRLEAAAVRRGVDTVRRQAPSDLSRLRPFDRAQPSTILLY